MKWETWQRQGDPKKHDWPQINTDEQITLSVGFIRVYLCSSVADSLSIL
jgi:hypothetical protein